jgi:putative hydrolase of the HAD superfamily
MRAIQKATLLNSRSGLSAVVPRRIVIAYWLIPAEPAHSFFQGVINDLAHRYDAPFFEPHVTVHVGANRADAAEKAISKAARECQPVKLKALEIDHSDVFIKTLFVQFAPNRKLQRLNAIIRSAAQDSSQYGFNPHLSLLYKNVLAAARRELARSIKVPFSEVVFDEFQAVRCISPTQNRADVEAWRVITRRSLRSISV